ncbi:MAG: hypothetical protein HQ582_02330 [Planctomycetes bacterium]|nr:hypothetical protein [Planctomycetota bacterium]
MATTPRLFSEIMARLTTREAEVLELFVAEASDVRVAARLGNGTQTVRNHMASIHKKLGVRTRAELMKLVLLTKLRDEFTKELS